MRKKLKSFTPKGYQRIIFTDGYEILCKGYKIIDNIYIFEDSWGRVTTEAGYFAYWSKNKVVNIHVYCSVARIEIF